MWRDAPMNLHWQTRAYNIFALLTLSYIWQLEKPPQDIVDEARKGIFRMARGPANFASVADMIHLKEGFALPVSFRCVEWSACAAQIQVVLADKGMQSWRAMTREHDRLERKWSASEHGSGCPFMMDWYKRSFLRRLVSNRVEVDCICGCPESVRASRLDESVSIEQDSSWPQQIQRTYYALLESKAAYDPVLRIRKKMSRLNLQDDTFNGPPRGTVRDNTPAGRAERTHRNLHALSRVCTPRVQTAVWGWLWNKWATNRRCKQGQKSVCRLCNTQDSEDSTEHLCRCHMVRRLFRTLNLDTEVMLGKRAWALACPSMNSVENLALLGMGMYATNTVAARIRHADSMPLSEEDTLEALRQSVKESAKGCGQAIRILKTAWVEDRHTCASPIPPKLEAKSAPITRNTCKRLKMEDNATAFSRMVRASSVRCNGCGHGETWCVCERVQ